MIRMLDHTADVGFEVRAPTREALFETAREGLLRLMFQHPPTQGSATREVTLQAPDLEFLLVRWLNELIYLVQTAGFVPARAAITITEDAQGFTLRARLEGQPFDAEAMGWQGEIKSATFHGLEVRPETSGWWARVVLDV
ncbi:archease [Marinithermus hydrothermalis]|uniref:Archease domain-containing protein n=1 Tax=Marinithermus hydrothermalis (strain DSM 14884 / JCM 11576 / T1) TaxID=869210 RepID=F2NNB3_MARHT|nr:archease [Marinithermus hydrothermalis]AEB10954.1 protein of unknown function DUF101 [Marinithermus hydrothermalis DSM 14884]